MAQALKGIGTVAVAGLAAWAFFYPRSGAWGFAAVQLVFVFWLAWLVRRADAAPLAAQLEGDERDVVMRYPLYFARPELCEELASMLAAFGLASLLLVPWLTYKLQWMQAVPIGACLFVVGRLTKVLSPVNALRLAASKGDREALRLLGAHDGALAKLAPKAR